MLTVNTPGSTGQPVTLNGMEDIRETLRNEGVL